MSSSALWSTPESLLARAWQYHMFENSAPGKSECVLRAPALAARRVAGERVELGQHLNRHGAGEDRAPDGCGLVEDVEPLGAAGRAGVPPDRRHGRRVVEAFAGPVVVDDDDGRGVARGNG